MVRTKKPELSPESEATVKALEAHLPALAVCVVNAVATDFSCVATTTGLKALICALFSTMYAKGVISYTKPEVKNEAKKKPADRKPKQKSKSRGL